MEFKEYLIADLIDEIAMGPFGSNIKVSCFVDSGVLYLMEAILTDFLCLKALSAMLRLKRQIP